MFSFRIGGVILLAVALNAFAFSWHVANPVIASDAWWFMDAFGRAVLSGDADWRSFFISRGAADHVQPLHKLMLLAHLTWFDLDFRVDGVVATLFGVLSAGLLVSLARGQASASGWPTELALGCTGAALLSLNSTTIYTWPLVTQFFMLLPFILLLFLAARDGVGPSAVGRIFLVAFVVILIADNTGVIACGAAIVVAALSAWRDRRLTGPLTVVAVLVSAILTVRGFQSIFLDRPSGGAGSVATAIQGLVPELANAWKWIVIPAASSLVHPSHIHNFRPIPEHVSMVLIAATALGAHLWFWRTWWQNPSSAVGQVSACLMVFVYLSTLAIILFRVSESGSEYLAQHRYVMKYQLANVAILMTAAARVGQEERLRTRVAVLAPCVGFLILQVVVSILAWDHARYALAYQRQMASQLLALGANPAREAPECVPLLTVCNWQADRRSELITLLRDRQLNVFSPRVRQRYGYTDPPVDEAPP